MLSLIRLTCQIAQCRRRGSGSRRTTSRLMQSGACPRTALVFLSLQSKKLSRVCDSEQWDLSARYLKYAVKFRTAGDRNVFSVNIRKRQDHRLRFWLGPDFEITSIEMGDEVCQALRHAGSTSRWWWLPLATAPIERCKPLVAFGARERSRMIPQCSDAEPLLLIRALTFGPTLLCSTPSTRPTLPRSQNRLRKPATPSCPNPADDRPTPIPPTH